MKRQSLSAKKKIEMLRKLEKEMDSLKEGRPEVSHNVKYKVTMEIEIDITDTTIDDLILCEAIKEKLSDDLLWIPETDSEESVDDGFLIEVIKIDAAKIIHYKIVSPKSDNHERIGKLIKFITPERLQIEFDDGSQFIYSLIDVIEVA